MTISARPARTLATVGLIFAVSSMMWAQGGRVGAPPQAPPTPRQMAPVDLTGYWVSVVTEDWRFRMLTPPKGDLIGVPLTPKARQVANEWDPVKDEAAGVQCRAYGAAGLMRLPGRAHITWEDDRTLKLEYDTGQQTRLLHFTGSERATGPGEFGVTAAGGTESSWQGYSIAEWEREVSGLPSGTPPRGGGPGGGGPPLVLTRSLKVMTTRLRSGYLRRNGIPYGPNAALTEYFDLRSEQDGNTWFTVVSIVEDPENLTGPYITSSDFKKEPDGSRWEPRPCSAK